MEQKTPKIYPSATLENVDLEQRLEKKLNYVNSFDFSINTIEETINYFKHKNHKSKKIYKKHKTLTTFLKSFDTFVSFASPSGSIKLFFTGISFIVIPKATGIARGLTNSTKITYDIVMQKYQKYKNQYQKDQQTIKTFEK